MRSCFQNNGHTVQTSLTSGPKPFLQHINVVQSRWSIQSRRRFTCKYCSLASRGVKTGSCPCLARSGQPRHHRGETPGRRNQDLDLYQGRPQLHKNVQGRNVMNFVDAAKVETLADSCGSDVSVAYFSRCNFKIYNITHRRGRSSCVEKTSENRATRNIETLPNTCYVERLVHIVFHTFSSMSFTMLKNTCTGMKGREGEIHEARDPPRLFQRVIVG